MFSNETLTMLSEKGFLRADGRPDTKTIADAIIAYLQKKGEASVAKIAGAVIGSKDDEEVRMLVSRLTSLDGRVQRQLNGDGYVLYHKPVIETLTDEAGNAVKRTMRIRAVTQDPSIIRTQLVASLEDKFTRMTRRQFNILAKYVVRRHPTLKAEMPAFRARLAGAVDKQYKALLGSTEET